MEKRRQAWLGFNDISEADGANDDPLVAVVAERLNPGRREVGVRSERERRERKNELQRQRRAVRMGLHAVSGEQQATLAGEVSEAEQLRVNFAASEHLSTISAASDRSLADRQPTQQRQQRVDDHRKQNDRVGHDLLFHGWTH
ncbi:hypothetical protein GN958_ATG14155 [Phytophthora infestans]|uniref:Uncharacterized protein n=1 Tax=Phytophthora infestans TaxID=4787 RepID=A0A8S9U6H7_PHYIN|nr:hypothetical protein GN958_ATG14155 [Phytophthora infestans]